MLKVFEMGDDISWDPNGFTLHSQAMKELFAELLGTIVFSVSTCIAWKNHSDR